MGCGSSQVDPSGDVKSGQPPGPKPVQNGTSKNVQNGQAKKISSTDSNANQTDAKSHYPKPMPPPGPCKYQLGLDARKPVFGGLRTTKAQTNLRICTV